MRDYRQSSQGCTHHTATKSWMSVLFALAELCVGSCVGSFVKVKSASVTLVAKSRTEGWAFDIPATSKLSGSDP